MKSLMIAIAVSMMGHFTFAADANWRCRAQDSGLARYLDVVIYNQRFFPSRTQGLATIQGEIFGYMVPRAVHATRKVLGTQTQIEYQISKSTKLMINDVGLELAGGFMNTSIRKDKVTCSRSGSFGR